LDVLIREMCKNQKRGWGSTILRFLTVPVPDGIENATHNTFGT
jgi:hypothetical protein